MDRILTGVSTPIQVTFSRDGDPENPAPDSATVRILRSDGTELVPATAAVDTGTGVFLYTLTPTQTATLDLLTVEWTATFDAVPQTIVSYVEVVGGFLFTISEARNLSPLGNETAYPTVDLLAARTAAETALEEACGTAFVPRYFNTSLDGQGTTDLVLPNPYARPLSITAATVDGNTADLTGLQLYPDGTVYLPGGWAKGRRNVVLRGTYGYRYPPPRVGRATLLLAKRLLVDSPVSDRTTMFQNEDGTSQWFVTEGVRQAVFDVPQANSVIQEYGVKVGIS